jgi:hypothetical protein
MDKRLPTSVLEEMNSLSNEQRVELTELVDLAVEGDEAALKAFEEKASFAPYYLSDTFGNLGKVTRDKLLRAFLELHPAYRRGVEIAAEDLVAEMLGTEPTPVERLLVEQVVSCWVESSMVDQVATEKLNTGETTNSQLEFYHRWQGRAQRRFLAACKTLAQVRKLLGINVQINIAEKQINVQGSQR